MKLIASYILLLVKLISSCRNQGFSDTLNLHYLAQTRGFKYEIILKTTVLEINNNNIINTIDLNEFQYSKIDSLINEINFEEIKNNISLDDLAVDRAIKGIFNVKFGKKEYLFEFNHNNLPKEIQELITYLENLN